MATHHFLHRNDAAEAHGFHLPSLDSHIQAFHNELPWHQAPASNTERFDAKMSVNQMIAAGNFVDARPTIDTHLPIAPDQRLLAMSPLGANSNTDTRRTIDGRDSQLRELKLPQDKIPKVNIVFEETAPANHAGQPSREPDFIITKQGKIEVHNDFMTHPNPDGQIIVRVERGANQLDPTAEETKSLNKLMTYIHESIQLAQPLTTNDKLQISDDKGLIDGSVRTQIAAPSHWDLPAPTQQQVERVNRFDGGEGTLDRRQVDDYFPRREVPPAPDESFSVVAMKDAVASLFHPDSAQPYETVRQRNDGGYSIGRYGFSENLLRLWLLDLLGDPPDFDRLDDLAKHGKVPKSFAKHMHDPKFRQGFCKLMEKLKGGHGAITSDEVGKYLPKELQEHIATDTIKHFTAGGERNPGKIGLSMLLGKAPEKLTQAELSAEGNQQYMGAASRLFGLAQARQMMDKNDKIEWSGTSPMGAKIAHVAEQTARNMDTIGWCARGVETAFAKLGINFSGHAADTREFFEHDKRFAQVSMRDLQPGDVVVRGRSSSHKYGHIFVYLGNGKEASDHIQSVTNGAAYGPSVAFRYVGDRNSRNT